MDGLKIQMGAHIVSSQSRGICKTRDDPYLSPVSSPPGVRYIPKILDLYIVV
jgi:hypothetical protein